MANAQKMIEERKKALSALKSSDTRHKGLAPPSVSVQRTEEKAKKIAQLQVSYTIAKRDVCHVTSVSNRMGSRQTLRTLGRNRTKELKEHCKRPLSSCSRSSSTETSKGCRLYNWSLSFMKAPVNNRSSHAAVCAAPKPEIFCCSLEQTGGKHYLEGALKTLDYMQSI